MRKKKIAIIGAGISGLTAGNYAVRNGFNVEIYEMHSVPGGLCTSWKRKDYLFDGSLHWITGSSPQSPFYNLWDELDLIKDRTFLNFDEFYRLKKGNREFIVYTDIDKFREHMIELSEEDRPLIEEFISDIKTMKDYYFSLDKPFSMYKLKDIIRVVKGMKPFGKLMKRYNELSIKEFASKFKSDIITDGLQQTIPSEYPSIALVITFSGFLYKDNGVTLGGSLAVSESLADKFEKAGGKIYYKSKIKKIAVKKNTAYGIELENGNLIEADYVLSTADPHQTIYDFLDKRYLNRKLKKLFNKGTTYTSLQVSIGVDADLKNYPHWLMVESDKPFNSGGMTLNYLSFHHYCYDPAMAPDGKSTLVSIILCDYNYWKNLDYNSDKYKKEKKRIGNEISSLLEKKYPEVKGKIEIVDVATPLTFERYFNVWNGAYMAWYTVPFKNTFLPVPQKLPWLKNLYLSGMWIMRNGGVPPAMITGKWAIQLICSKEKKDFII